MSVLAMAAVFLGGGSGALSRYATGRFMGKRYTGVFPVGTCLINVVGCFFLGFLTTLASAHAHTGFLMDLLATGFLGGYSTFSTYVFEGVAIFKDGVRTVALWSLSIPVVLGLFAAAIGALAGQSVNGG